MLVPTHVKLSTEKLECENSLMVSNSAHTSFFTVKLKQPSEVTISKQSFEWKVTIHFTLKIISGHPRG